MYKHWPVILLRLSSVFPLHIRYCFSMAFADSCEDLFRINQDLSNLDSNIKLRVKNMSISMKKLLLWPVFVYSGICLDICDQYDGKLNMHKFSICSN